MLPFFRRIRQSLLTNGAARKYLFYAAGEVLLVMIGILLALQVNNWNENRKAEKLAVVKDSSFDALTFVNLRDGRVQE